MSQQIDLTTAWAKVRHAEEHIATLRTFYDAVRSQEKYQAPIGAELDEATGQYILRVTDMPALAPMAEKVSLIVGDITHNLRSALDHLAWQLACERRTVTPKNEKNIVFPICDPPQRGRTCSTPNYLATADWQKMHEFEPCKGINNRPDGWSASYVHQLTLLRSLSNDDKHKTLPVTLIALNGFSTIRTRTSLPPWLIKIEEGFDVIPERMSEPDPDDDRPDFGNFDPFKVEVGEEVCRMRAPAWEGKPVIDHVGTASPIITLDEHRPAPETM
ncbi:MAG: hypothetical protein LC808_44330, partial [Actinobacteria bacterium]|nr:hypothetical protein [Actinomycetota bacterium]